MVNYHRRQCPFKIQRIVLLTLGTQRRPQSQVSITYSILLRSYHHTYQSSYHPNSCGTVTVSISNLFHRRQI